MPVALTEKPAPYDPVPNRIRWTRQQCDTMRDMGFLTGHYELLDGEILSKMGQKPTHAYVVRAILSWLASLFGPQIIQVESTLDLSEVSPAYDEPEPDVVVTAQPYTHYADRHPGPRDVVLLVEVSDTTLRFDLNAKATLYARANIREYWVVDISGRRIVVHRQPAAEGYTEIMAYDADEEVSPLARAEAQVHVSNLLPPA